MLAISRTRSGLRALLIQIGVKQVYHFISNTSRLRALLIQIGVKPVSIEAMYSASLRALLIQIGVKLNRENGTKRKCLRALCLCSDRDTGIVLIFFKISRLIL